MKYKKIYKPKNSSFPKNIKEYPIDSDENVQTGRKKDPKDSPSTARISKKKKQN